jgi:hypothetical protein
MKEFDYFLHLVIIPPRAASVDGPGRVAIQSQYGGEEEPHWGWTALGPDGSWRNHNPNPPASWNTKDREP